MPSQNDISSFWTEIENETFISRPDSLRAYSDRLNSIGSSLVSARSQYLTSETCARGLKSLEDFVLGLYEIARNDEENQYAVIIQYLENVADILGAIISTIDTYPGESRDEKFFNRIRNVGKTLVYISTQLESLS